MANPDRAFSDKHEDGDWTIAIYIGIALLALLAFKLGWFERSSPCEDRDLQCWAAYEEDVYQPYDF